MNRSEEKQVFLLGRILQRDLGRVERLLELGKLKAPVEAVEFSREVIRMNPDVDAVDSAAIVRAYNSSFHTAGEEYRQVKDLLVSQ
jgi:hypothetical protein